MTNPVVTNVYGNLEFMLWHHEKRNFLNCFYRPRESTPSSFEVSDGRGVDAYEKGFANNEDVPESRAQRSSFEIQDNSSVKGASSSSEFVIAGKDISKVDEYSLAETDSSVKASSS